jgi:hypothetical protein
LFGTHFNVGPGRLAGVRGSFSFVNIYVYFYVSIVNSTIDMKNLRNLFVKQLDQRYAALRPVIRTAPDMGWLRSLRMGLGISLQQVADRQGVSKQHVSQAEKTGG